MPYNTIIVKGRGLRKEGKAAGAITPGHLVKIDSNGELVVHATAGGPAQKAFAVENELVGNEITDAYADNDHVFYEIVQAGAEVNALVPANAAAIVKGDLLESNGDGTFRKFTAPLTDNTAGTANTTLEALADGTTYATDVGAIRNNFADLAAQLNKAQVNSVLAIALEAVDNSAEATTARILVEVL